MTDHDLGHDNVLKELDAALQVEPSRAFADGVRARVNRSSTNTARVWWGLAAAASIGLATLTLWRPAPESASVAAVTPPKVAPITQPAAKASSITTPPSVVAAPQRPASRERTVTPVVATTTASGTEPRLEVITNQGAVLRALWADYQRRPLVIAEGAPVVESLTAAEIVVNPIAVRPIVVSEIGKEPGPAGATPIIRRADATKETK